MPIWACLRVRPGPGHSQVPGGTGFGYRSDAVSAIDTATRTRIRKLVIPPAWTDVWICATATGHIQATGRDARGRKQYIYHPDWRRVRDEHKFDSLITFAQALPRVRARVDADMRRHGRDRRRVLATVVHLLDRTLIRSGMTSTRRRTEALASQRSGTATCGCREMRCSSTSKARAGRSGNCSLRIAHARVLRSLQDLPGQNLFQFEDEDGEVRALTSHAVNAYIRDVVGRRPVAKYFRTWGGTVLAAMALSSLGHSRVPPKRRSKCGRRSMQSQTSSAIRRRSAANATSIPRSSIPTWPPASRPSSLARPREGAASGGKDSSALAASSDGRDEGCPAAETPPQQGRGGVNRRLFF